MTDRCYLQNNLAETESILQQTQANISCAITRIAVQEAIIRDKETAESKLTARNVRVQAVATTVGADIEKVHGKIEKQSEVCS